MTRTMLAGMLTLILLAALTPRNFTGPPERVSGRMTLPPDEVADGLMRYNREKGEDRRVAWLKRLAPTGDLRVVVALGEGLSDRSQAVRLESARELHRLYGRPAKLQLPDQDLIRLAEAFWLDQGRFIRPMAGVAP